MRIEPASVSQVRLAETGEMVEISADAGMVADDLRKIDKGLKVRFPVAAKEPAWIVYHERHDDCPHNGTTDAYLVLTAQAHQNVSGTWEGLDQRVVQRIMQIGHSSYDYAKELEAAARRTRDEKRKAASEKFGELAENAAHALRKDLGARYKGRAFT